MFSTIANVEFGSESWGKPGLGFSFSLSCGSCLLECRTLCFKAVASLFNNVCLRLGPLKVGLFPGTR